MCAKETDNKDTRCPIFRERQRPLKWKYSWSELKVCLVAIVSDVFIVVFKTRDIYQTQTDIYDT